MTSPYREALDTALARSWAAHERRHFRRTLAWVAFAMLAVGVCVGLALGCR